ncbi:MAG: phosphoribosyl-AMP cyclohydrolase [Candidatus Omnitrophica bacterium]|nr:phosphoribosyl-AMP cyclohydrolase [Candidatus Omnitrophota bacterium]
MKRPSKSAQPIPGYRALRRILQFNDQGLVPTIIQDAKSRQVLTLCYLNEAALKKSLETGTVYLFRRSQRRLMQKGETSGHIQVIRELCVDCEGQSLLLLVDQRVAACHAGYFTCYFRQAGKDGRLKIVGRKAFNPDAVYRSSGYSAF